MGFRSINTKQRNDFNTDNRQIELAHSIAPLIAQHLLDTLSHTR